MVDQLPETANFGFTRVGAGEPQSKNGWAFSDGDRVKLDQLMYAALNHTHSGDPALGDPTDPPTMTALPTGGTLASATTYYYRVSFVDQWGLETASSPEGSITTGNPLLPPTAPAVTIENTGGTVGPGVYSYLISFVDAQGGQTTPSPLAAAQVLAGAANRVKLLLPELPSGATSYNIYRSRPGQSQFYYLTNTSAAFAYDTGTAEDQSITAPTLNTTNSNNSIQVTIPLGFIPEGCFGWKIYRALASGDYDGNSLVHWVTEGATDTSTTPRITWTDTGDSLLSGFPQNKNSSATSGLALTLAGLTGPLPLASMPRGAQVYSTFSPGPMTDGEIVAVTEVPMPLQPTRFTAFFKTPPDDAGVTVTLTVSDASANSVALACSSTTHQANDPAGYFHVEYPLFLEEAFEAEAGIRIPGSIAIVNDLGASGGQAVPLSAQNDLISFPLGALDPGEYRTFFTCRVLQFADGSVNDLVVNVARGDTQEVIGGPISFSLAATGSPDVDPTLYVERNGPTFTAPGGAPLYLQVFKGTATTQFYNVDSARMTATVPTLQPGLITTSVAVTGGSSSSADVNLALWF